MSRIDAITPVSPPAERDSDEPEGTASGSAAATGVGSVPACGQGLEHCQACQCILTRSQHTAAGAYVHTGSLSDLP